MVTLEERTGRKVLSVFRSSERLSMILVILPVSYKLAMFRYEPTVISQPLSPTVMSLEPTVFQILLHSDISFCPLFVNFRFLSMSKVACLVKGVLSRSHMDVEA
jgi:hypothetical protein